MHFSGYLTFRLDATTTIEIFPRRAPRVVRNGDTQLRAIQLEHWGKDRVCGEGCDEPV